MKTILEFFKRHPVAVFTVLVYVITWPVWFFAAKGNNALANFMMWFGNFGPAICAIILTGVFEGRNGLNNLLVRLFGWRFNPLWYIIAVLLPVIGTITLILINSLINGVGNSIGFLGDWLSQLGNNSGGLFLFLLFGLIALFGEEIGWRGYVLPIIRANHSDLYASLLVGLIWGLWHLPNLWPINPNREAIDLLIFMGDILTVSILYTWIYANTRESILPVTLFHSSYDVMVYYGSETLPFLHEVRGYEMLVMLIIALAVVAFYGTLRFEPNHKHSDLSPAGE